MEGYEKSNSNFKHDEEIQKHGSEIEGVIHDAVLHYVMLYGGYISFTQLLN